MTSTVPDEQAVVNLVRPNLGHGARDLYDWLKTMGRMGGKRRVELTPPVSRYEQVAGQLRHRIFSGEFPSGSRLPSGAREGEYPVSQPVVQRAFEVLAREGLVRMEPGRGTIVLERQWFRVEVIIEPAPGEAFRTARSECEKAMAAHPAVAEGTLHLGDPSGLAMVMVVEAAELAGAATVALGIAKQAAGPAPATSLSVRAEPEAGRG